MESNSEMQQLLERLDKANRQQVFYARLQCIFSIAAALCCLALVLIVSDLIPQIQQIAQQIHDLAAQAETVLTNLESVTHELAQVDLSSMVNNVDSLVTTSQVGVEQAIQKINNIDFDTLNQAITNLSKVVEPMAKFFKVFG